MMKKHIILLMLLPFFLGACSDFLGNKPKGYSIPEYYQDYILLLNGSSLNYYGNNDPLFITDDVILSDGEVDDEVLFNYKSPGEQNLYTFKSGSVYPKSESDYFWDDSYKQVYVYNVVANNIYDVQDAPLEKKDAAWAEAVTCRAINFFHLVNNYAKQYDPATAAKDNGIPLVLSEDISKSYKMNTVQEVYDKILADLEKAAPMLPEATQNKYHPNRTSAYTLLSRVHLFMGNFDKALEAADKALAANKQASMLDLKIYHAEPTGWGRLQTDDGDVYPIRGDSPEDLYVKLAPMDPAGTTLASRELYDLYDKDLAEGAVDMRKELYYAEDSVTLYSTMYFKGYVMYVAKINPNYGLTYQELLLNAAECEARIGDPAKAMKYLDEIRDSRIKNNQPLVASGKDDALRLVLEERRREMAMWGQARFFDLRRLNIEPALAKEIVHDLDGEKFTLPANDPRYIMPLPSKVLEFNPSLPQYER